MFDFSERDREIINHANELGSFEVLVTDNQISITISKEARDLLSFLKDNGIEYEKPAIEWCG
jgi:hypothetical protein